MRTDRTGVFLERKIKSLTALKPIIARLRRSGRKVVFTNGCFDLLHYGHVRYLERARALGDLLVVGVNSDSSVRELKGARRPLVAQHDRSRLVAALESVDFVTVFSGPTPYAVIRTLRPDVLVKGGDWKKDAIVGSGLVNSWGGRVATIPFAKGRSTSGLCEKIAKTYR